MTTSQQNVSNKISEISFRKKLLKGEFREVEPHNQELHKELESRLNNTQKDIRELVLKGIKISPFLEIGAERGQRGMLLESKFNAKGYILDISLPSLLEADKLKKPLGLHKIPERVSADAYSLPFPNNTFAFVFTYQTLHHFPDPTPIIKEIYRVLSPGGTFFFNEEPVRQTLNLRLWRRPTKLRWWEKLLKVTTLLHFLSEIGKSETEAGIIETSFTLSTWEQTLNVFDKTEVTLKAFPFGPSQSLSSSKNKQWLKPKPTTNFFLNLMGGNIQAICQKKGNLKSKKPAYSCPKCNQRSHLKRKKLDLICPNCGDLYPIKNGIPILIKRQLRTKLYD